ncbi:hypothetical protein GF325_16265 [Candidatus Bathyarchaeota archaeon]|nr:hypothetical protein [Candidatus Bathyarchaeota archaeon]
MPFACLIDASRALTFEDASMVYKDGYSDLLRALMDNAPDLSHKFAMVRALRAVGKRHDRQLELLNTVHGVASIGT